eukprot:gene6248-7492_t
MSVANVKEETTAGEVASSRVTEEEDEIESQKSRFRRTARARHKTIVENRRQKLNASAGLQKMLKTAKKVVGMRMAMKQLGVHKPEVGAEATSEDATVGLASTQSSPLKAEPRDASSSSGDVVGGSNHSSPTPAGSGSVAENVTKNLCPADSLGEDAPVNSDVQKEGSLTVAPNADVIKTRIYRVLTSAASGLRCKGELAPLLNFLEDVQGIARLSDSQKFNLVHAFALVEFEPNEYVCNVGDPTDTYFVCLDGKLE